MASGNHAHDDHRHRMFNEVEDDQAHLTRLEVRYEDSAKSLAPKRVRWYPRMFEGALQNACSLVMMK